MLSVCRPAISSNDVPLIVKKMYNLEVNVIRELDSSDDQNFLVEVVPGSNLPPNVQSVNQHGYVLKVLNSLDSMKPDVVEAQTQIILHTQRAGYPTYVPVPTVDDQYQKLLSFPSSIHQDGKLEHYIVLLFTFIPGQALSEVTLTPQLCFEVGWFTGRLDRILMNFPSASCPALTSMIRKWNMSQIPKLRDKLNSVLNVEQRCLAEKIMEQFEKQVLSIDHKYSKGLIHSDFNDCNILVSQECSYAAVTKDVTCSNLLKTDSVDEHQNNRKEENVNESDQKWHVNGIIDFGDTTLSLYVFEVAIAIAYVMINKHGIPPMQAASLVLRGYLQHVELTDFELQHLKLCICARLVQSLVFGYVSLTQDPDDKYIFLHAKRVWPVLKSLWEMPDSEVLTQLMEHINNEHHPECVINEHH